MKISINSSTSIQNFSQLCLHYDEEIFFLYCSVTDLSFLQSLITKINSHLPQYSSFSYHIVPDKSLDRLIKEQTYLNFFYDNYTQCLVVPLEFLNFVGLAKEFLSFPCKTIREFYSEIFRFQPKLLNDSFWLSVPEKELSDLFNLMLSQNLASIEMMAVLFECTLLTSPQKYFSSRVAQELMAELNTERERDLYFLQSIMYVIERNFLLIFHHKSVSGLEEQQMIFHAVHNYFLTNQAKILKLSDLNFIGKMDLYHSINQIPYYALVTFLQLSNQDNFPLIKKAFSREGQIKLEQDIRELPIDIRKLKYFFKAVAQLEVSVTIASCHDLMARNLKSAQSWELLLRELDLQVFFKVLDSFDEKKCLGGNLRLFYYFYSKKQIGLPTSKELSLQECFTLFKEQIVYLKISGFLT